MNALRDDLFPELGSLSADQRVTFRVGQIMRLTVRMEDEARAAHAVLRGIDHPESGKSGPDGFGAMIAEVRRLLVEAAPPFLSQALASLDFAVTQYNERSSFAHDKVWEIGDDSWQRRSLESAYRPRHVSPVSEDSMESAVLAAAQASLQMSGLSHLARAIVMERRGALRMGFDDPSVAFYIRMLDCRLERLADGAIEATIPG